MAKPESFDLYHKSGTRRTIRLKAWGFARRGKLRTNYVGTPAVHLGPKEQIANMRMRGEKLVELQVTIKASPTKKTG